MTIRLLASEITAIKNVFSKFSDSNTQLYIFGSRVDPLKKGGDIDLLIVFLDINKKNQFKHLDFIVALKKQIGDRAIDVTLAKKSEIATDEFLQTIITTAVLL